MIRRQRRPALPECWQGNSAHRPRSPRRVRGERAPTLVAAQNGIDLARWRGGGDVTSAGGLRFVGPVAPSTLAPTRKYFGLKRAVTYYNLVSDQFTGLNAITVPGTLCDSLVLLSVVLEQETEFDPTEVMTDTGAYIDVIFGIFWLLGYQFSPRIADVGDARFWRVDPAADYGPLDKLASHGAKMGIITEHWDDLLRLAGSLKLMSRAGRRADADAPDQRTADPAGADAGGARPDRQGALPAGLGLHLGLHRRRSLPPPHPQPAQPRRGPPPTRPRLFHGKRG